MHSSDGEKREGKSLLRTLHNQGPSITRILVGSRRNWIIARIIGCLNWVSVPVSPLDPKCP